jgi:hypothetical protein
MRPGGREEAAKRPCTSPSCGTRWNALAARPRTEPSSDLGCHQYSASVAAQPEEAVVPTLVRSRRFALAPMLAACVPAVFAVLATIPLERTDV